MPPQLNRLTYIAHERSPELFRLSELVGVYKAMTEDGQRIMRDALDVIFLP